MNIDIDWDRISVLACEVNDLENQNLSEETKDNIMNYATKQILRELSLIEPKIKDILEENEKELGKLINDKYAKDTEDLK